jgi:hypothetical protein
MICMADVASVVLLTCLKPYNHDSKDHSVEAVVTERLYYYDSRVVY